MNKNKQIVVRRAYDARCSKDEVRVLVDRLWPRGLSKEKASLDYHLKEVAPSNELRKWYSHDPEKFIEFEQRYRKELQDERHRSSFMQLQKIVQEHQVVTLLTASKRFDISVATVLKKVLTEEL